MIIDLKCPVELRGYEIIYDDIGAPLVWLELFNLSDYTITKYSFILHSENIQGNAVINSTHEVDNVSISGGTEFKLELPTELFNADRIELYFTCVEFEDCDKWLPDDQSILVDISELKPLVGDELDKLRDIAGEDAVIYPEMQDNYWRCVCGRINTLDENECYRCRRERDVVLKELNYKILNLTSQATAERKKQKKKAKKARERMREETKSKMYVLFLITAIVLFLMLFVYVSVILPGFKM